MDTLSVATLMIDGTPSPKKQLTIESLPQELLQQVFDFVVSHDGDDLAAICLVSRYWRMAVLGHPVLWTYEIPTLRIPRDIDSSEHEIQNRKLRLCIARSGSLPLSLSISLSEKDWRDRRELVLATIPLVTDQCHRWRAVRLTLPVEAWGPVLSPIRGKLTLLEKLDFSIPFPGEPGEDETWHISLQLDFFAESPSLHDVSINMYGLILATDQFNVALPWSQLSSFDGNWLPRCSVYRELISTSRPNLEIMRYQSRFNTPMPSGPSTALFPSLTRFYFSEELGTTTDDFAAHLDTLILPSLTHLEIVNSNAFSELFTRKLLSLVQRSRCPLKHLDIRTNAPPNNTAFMSILSLCPSINDLSVREISAEYLLHLVLDPTACDPILPVLRKFRICVPTVHTMDGEDGLVEADVPALMCMIESRTLALDNRKADSSNHRFQALKYIFLYGFDSVKLHSALTRWECESEELRARRKMFNSPSPDTANDALVELAARLETTFNAVDGSYELTFEEFEKIHSDANSALRELERLDFEHVNTSIFTRRNVAYGLTCIGHWSEWRTMEPHKVDRESVNRLHSRAKALLEKCRPFLLRDARACPLLWRYWYGVRGGQTRLQWWIAQLDDEEALWEAIIGFE